MVTLFTLQRGDAKPNGDVRLSKIAHVRCGVIEKAKRWAARQIASNIAKLAKLLKT
jgi:hypothetical protein